MALGQDDDYVFWTAFDELNPDIADFVSAPYDILIGSDGNQISQSDWRALNVNQKLDCIYRTVAVNKARKVLGYSSLKQIRYEKNTVNETFSTENNGSLVYSVSSWGGSAPSSTAAPKLQLTAGKRYVITFPASKPLNVSLFPDGRGDKDGIPAEPYTKGVTIDENAKTLTIDVANDIITLEDQKLYYYCETEAGMGNELEIDIPYTAFVPADTEVEGQIVPDENTEFQANTPVYDASQFVDILVADIAVDSSGFSSHQTKVANALSFIPTAPWSDNLTNFKKKCGQGRMFVDSEDAIDAYGNKIEESQEEIASKSGATQHIAHQHADSFGAALPPTDLDGEIKSKTVANATSSFWKKVHSEQIKLRTLFQPAPIDDNSIKKVSQNLLSFNAGSHTVIEFNEKGETDNYIQEGLYFDDLNYLLNIKDPGYGIDNDGFKGQDLSKIQKIRTCLIIDDYSIIGKFDDAEFSADDQPKGALYIGDTIIAPPMSYIPAFYDDAPRLVLGYYGSDANNLNINNNLAYRIFNDFTRLEVADTTVTDPVPSVPLSSVTIENVKALNLNWSASASLHSQLHADFFSIRAKDGSTKGPAFLSSSTPSTTPRKPFAITTTVTSTDLGLSLDPVKSFTYKVLAPNERLNISHFQFNEQHRFYVLDEYGFDVNPTASIGPSSANNIFYYTPPIIE